MSFNNRIMRGLIASIFLSSMLLIENNVNWKNSLIESFIVSFNSGAIVSLFITFIQYQKEKNDIIEYCNNEITDYYQILSLLLFTISSKETNDKKIKSLKSIYYKYFEKASARNKDIRFNFFINNCNNFEKKKLYNILYECTNGLYLSIPFIDLNEKTIDNLAKVCKEQCTIIDEGMTILVKTKGIKYPWKDIKETIDKRHTHKKYFKMEGN